MDDTETAGLIGQYVRVHATSADGAGGAYETILRTGVAVSCGCVGIIILKIAGSARRLRLTGGALPWTRQAGICRVGAERVAVG